MRLNYIDCIDCLEGLKEIPDKSVDLVVTDPPYFLSMGHAGSKETAFNTNSDQVTATVPSATWPLPSPSTGSCSRSSAVC